MRLPDAGVDDERRVIAHAIVRAQARRAVGAAAARRAPRRGTHRRRAVDLRAQADVDAAVGRDAVPSPVRRLIQNSG